MQTARMTADEDRRLAALSEYGWGADPADPTLNPIVQMATRIFAVPMAVVNLVARDHVFFAAGVGLDEIDASLTGRDISFCAHAVANDANLLVPDATLDPRFHDNPLVTGASHFRFYAGVPLRAPSGHVLGAFCIIDREARSRFTPRDCGQLEELAGLALDRLELRRLGAASKVSQARFRNIAANSPDGIICFDAEGRITDWNLAAERMFGHSAEEAIGRDVNLIVPPHMRATVDEDRRRLMAGDASNFTGEPKEVPGLARDGRIFPAEMSLSFWREDANIGFGVIMRDITERRRSESELYRLAHYDHLTGLTNRSVILKRAAEEIDARHPAAALAIDLDGFKDINDTLGSEIGDEILKETARRLEACARPLDTVARLGGDEFVMLLPDIGDPIEAAAAAETARAALARPFVFEDHEVHVTASAGIALYPAHCETADELLTNADLALFQAKSEGRNCCRLYAPHLRHAAQARRTYDVELRRAAANGEFCLFYQPQVMLEDGALTGAEALIRWQHPERGLIAPGAFIPQLEGSILAATIGDWVLDTACAQAAEWRAAGTQDFRMGVNLFGAQFRADNLVKRVEEALTRHRLPPGALELEITETIILDNDEAVLPPLRALREMGVGIAFDDYGTGYASLSLLKRYPVTRLKIDQSFVRTMCESTADAAISEAIVTLARSFGLEVIAEGIERTAQRDALKRIGCAEGQGFLFGRPMPAANFALQFGLGAAAARLG